MTTMATIWLVQYLCPHRHAIAAIPYDPAEWSQADVETELLAQLELVGVQPWCALCQSTELHFEHAKTRFTDWETALRALFASEQDQMHTRRLFTPPQN